MLTIKLLVKNRSSELIEKWVESEMRTALKRLNDGFILVIMDQFLVLENRLDGTGTLPLRDVMFVVFLHVLV